MSRYLKQGKTGQIYPWTEQLAARKDMEECDNEGNLVERPKVVLAEAAAEGVAPELIEQVRLEAGNAVKAEFAEVAGRRFGIELDPNMPAASMLDMILMAHEEEIDAKTAVERMTKPQMVAYAKETFNVDLDPDMKADAMRAKLAELAAA